MVSEDSLSLIHISIIYALIGLVVNTISGLSVKELPEEELNSGIENDEEKKDVYKRQIYKSTIFYKVVTYTIMESWRCHMKHSLEERMDIGRRMYLHEITYKAVSYTHLQEASQR